MSFHFGYWTEIRDPNEPRLELRKPGGDIDKDVPFDLESDTTLRIGGVLTFMTDAVSPNNLTYTIHIKNNNGNHQVINRTVDSAVLHAEQAVVPGSPLILGHGVNNLLIKITGGTGTLRISNIVLHYVRLS